jgi:hypothetical protein
MEIQLYDKFANPLDAINQVGEFFAKSGLFGCEKQEQGKVLAMICLAEKKSPVEITRNYDIIGGKLRKKTVSSFADFRARGGKVRWIKTGDDGTEARAEFTFEGQAVELAFGIDAAKKQGLVRPNSNWEKTPGNMLRARLLSNAIGMLCPEIFAGEDMADDLPTGPAPTIVLPAAEPVAAQPTARVVDVSATVTTSAQPVALEVVQPDDTKALAEMGLAPAQPAPAPAQVVVTDTVVNDVAAALTGNFLPAALWLMKQKWLPSVDGIDSEAKAAGYLEANLPSLEANRAQKIIKQRDSFLRAIKEVK